MLFTPKVAIGHIFIYPNGGLQPTNASGTELSTIQNFSVEFAGKGIELRGQFLYAVDARVVDVSGKGKFSVGEWSIEQLNNLFYAGTVATGDITDQVYADELHPVPASPAYTVTVTNAAGFVQPLSVSYASDLSNLEEVESGPTEGQYTVNATSGQFTFSADDAGTPMLFSYISGGTGAQLSIPNNLQAQSPVIGIAAYNAADGNGFLFPNCRVTGIKPLELKNNAYAMNEVDFQVFCPFGQQVGQIIQTNF